MTEAQESDETVLVKPKGSSGLRGVFRVLGGTTVGLIGLGALVILIGGSSLIPLPKVGSGLEPGLVTPVATDRIRVCPGPILRLGETTGSDATTAVKVGTESTVSASSIGVPTIEQLTPTSPTNQPARLLRLSPDGSGTVGLLSGSQSQSVAEPDLVGFAAIGCGKPDSDLWLVGGDTTTGRTTLLMLSNPSSVDSQVKVEVFSENGEEDVAGGNRLTVPAGGQQILSLAGLKVGIASPVLHVQSEGGRIVAALQQSIVRTLTPGGVDVFGPTVSPSTKITIPGVVVPDPSTIDSVLGEPGYEDSDGVLRVFVPATGVGVPDGTAHLTVTAIAEMAPNAQPDSDEPGSKDESSTATFDIPIGKVTDLPLADFASGSYTIELSSDQPAVAAVRTTVLTNSDVTSTDSTGFVPPTAIDFAWFVSAPELDQPTIVSVAPGPNPNLHFVNAGSAAAVIVIKASAGADNTFTLPSGGAISVPVTAGLNYSISGYAKLQLSVSYQGDGQLASFAIQDQGRSSYQVKVYVN